MAELRRTVIFTSPDHELLSFHWHGSLTINIYVAGIEATVMTLSHGETTEADARRAISDWLDEWDANHE